MLSLSCAGDVGHPFAGVLAPGWPWRWAICSGKRSGVLGSAVLQRRAACKSHLPPLLAIPIDFFLWRRSSKGFLHAGSFRQVGALGPLLPVRWLAPSWHGSFRIIAAGHATGANATVQHRKAVSLVGSIPRTQFEPMGQASGKKQLPMNLCKAAEANKQSDSSMDGSWLASD